MTPKEMWEDLTGRNPPAARLIAILHHVAGYWDDLIDRDKPIDDDRHNAMFHCLLVELPNNSFYQKNRHLLSPLIESVCISYEVSQVWERNKDEHGLELGHALRYRVADVIAYIVVMCYGRDVAMKVLPEYYKLISKERLSEYLEEQNGK